MRRFTEPGAGGPRCGLLVLYLLLLLAFPALAEGPAGTGAAPATVSPAPGDPAEVQQAPAPSERPEPRSVQAEFIRFVAPPGSSNEFVRPSAICFDRTAGELYVADAGNRRVVVFAEDGTYRFEFTGAEISTPLDIAVDSQGYVYVLDSTRSGRKILVHDFDGAFLREMKTDSLPDGRPLDPASIAFDDADNLYVLDGTNARVCAFDRAGSLQKTIPLFPELDESQRSELVLGTIRVADGSLLVPVSTLGSVYIYGLDGSLRKVIGHHGSAPGELSFPVAATIADGVLLALDKHRYEVVCFDLSGRFLGEFGGQGSSPGWFYHPTLLAVDREHRAYVGQVFLSRVQACRIPEFIVAGAHPGEPAGSHNPSVASSHAG